MKKIVKRVGIICVIFILIFGTMIFFLFTKTQDAVEKQVNVEIDMNLVADGIYTGSSDGGLVQVEVEVEVKDHAIQNITLVKHANGKGKPAEAMLDEMVKENTDNVDEVSGATVSSKTIRNAVNNALQQGLEK